MVAVLVAALVLVEMGELAVAATGPPPTALMVVAMVVVVAAEVVVEVGWEVALKVRVIRAGAEVEVRLVKEGDEPR